MSEWKKTSCAVCYHNCGLEIQTAGHQITKVRPDNDHPRTRGYSCRKGLKIAHYQDHRERLTHPLKREGDRFIRIPWEQAISEIAARLRRTLDEHGPKALALMGGAGQACHMEGGFARTLLTALGSQYHYSAAAQELTGLFWVNGRAYGGQDLHTVPDLDRAKNFLVMGWNGYVSNAGVNRPRNRINEFSKAPDKKLIVVDPHLSETAKRADMHVKLRVGTAALFLRSLIAIVIQEGWEDKAYIDQHCMDFEKILPWFKDFDVASALRVCHVDTNAARELARLYATEPTAMRTDLGLLMDRQSTMNSYLEMIFMAICGRVGTAGGNVFNGHLMPMGIHTDERDEKTWRTVETDIPAILGYFPPNVVPEEILSPKEDRLRAMIISNSNPLRSYADTLAYEKAFKELDLLVTIDIQMSETARLSHYVLPGKSAFEKWDGTFFAITFPEIYFQLRHPSCESLGEPLEEGEIYTRLADALGLLPEIPQSLIKAAQAGREVYGAELVKWMSQEEKAGAILPFIVAKTLGKGLHSVHLAAVWALLSQYPRHGAGDLARAGHEVNPFTGEALFQMLLEHPEGILIGKVDPDKSLEHLKTQDKKIHLYIPEMADWIEEIDPGKEEAALKNEEFPFVLSAGRHFAYNANTNMRDPAMNDHKTVYGMLISESDARALGLEEGDEVWVTTAAAKVRIPVEISDIPAQGSVIIPHGFGMIYDGKEYGVNVNLLAKNTHRDRLAGTPLHRFVPCRVQKG